MKKHATSIDEIRSYVYSLKGNPLNIKVNKGRNKIARFSGFVDEVYPSVFTLKIQGDKNIRQLSCSYSDIICGNIVLRCCNT